MNLETVLFLVFSGIALLVLIVFYLFFTTRDSEAQGFPADYYFAGTKTEKVKQIGNAVPPGFAKALLETILDNQNT